MTLRIRFDGKQLGKKFRQAMDDNYSLIARVTTASAHEAARTIKQRGDQDISSAGRFGRRWQQSLHADVTPRTGALVNARIDVYHTIPYASIFETGGVVRGSPFLWIPLSYTKLKMRARDYARRFGGLFLVRRKSKPPLLLSIRDKRPKYVAVLSVRFKKRFHLKTICGQVMRNFTDIYNRHIAKG